MEGFDDPGVFFSDNFSESQDDRTTSRVAIKKKFLRFLKEFQEGNFAYKYRDALKTNYLRNAFNLEVDLEDLKGFDESLAEKLKQSPTEMLGLLEEAAKEAADEVTFPRDKNAEEVEDIHVTLKWDQWEPQSVRELKSQQVFLHFLCLDLFLTFSPGVQAGSHPRRGGGGV